MDDDVGVEVVVGGEIVYCVVVVVVVFIFGGGNQLYGVDFWCVVEGVYIYVGVIGVEDVEILM